MPSRSVLETVAPVHDRHHSYLLAEAPLAFLASLEARFGVRRRELLEARRARQAAIDAGAALGFLPATRALRDAEWRVTPPPLDLRDRRVEITGPPDRKRMIHALNSGARVFMADFEDALAPTWPNLIEGQANLVDAVCGHLTFTSPEGRRYQVGPRPATLVIRPRGWHLEERHVRADGRPMSASLFDFGLYAFHNARILASHGSGVYVYLPKMESHLEARLWNEVFRFTESALELAPNSIRPSILIETLPAAFEMDEILWEFKDRSPALNAGRWDYLFSAIKTLRSRPIVLPDRNDVTMRAPFLWAYSQLLVRTCHRRGAWAIGGMAALIPDRRDAARNARALEAVRQEKRREASEGFDGTWVAHPDLVGVALGAFDEHLGGRTEQLDVVRPDLKVGAAELLYLDFPHAAATAAGLRANVRVALTYLAHWLSGTGAVAIDGRMEDTATAEIARAQVWQWVNRGVVLDDGRTVTRGLVEEIVKEEEAHAAAAVAVHEALPRARALFHEVALGANLPDFFTTAVEGAA
ncbi:MAG: malate synthase A [Thermoplasmatota archaeon]